MYDLVVRLKIVKLKYGVNLCVTHVSGKRMMRQGTDGVSMGSLKTGVATGEHMIDFCPWGRDPLKVEPSLKP